MMPDSYNSVLTLRKYDCTMATRDSWTVGWTRDARVGA
jgi:hypothetical protein